MLTQTYLGIPIYALVPAGVAIVAVIAFAIYIFLLKRRVAVYSQEFDAAIDEFNTGCNPGHPMTDEEWGQYRSSHDDDFEHAHKVASSKLIALFVRDISNANTLVDIDDNHQAYLDDARVKNGYISTFEQAIEEAIEAKRVTFDGLHYIAHSESLELEQKVKEATDAANLCIENNLLDYLTHAAECTELHEAIASLEDNRTSHNADFVKSELANCSDFFDHVLAYPLDPQQRDAIVNGEDNCIVVSSAGSGKTSTINGKVRYLVDRRDVDPDDILLISYTRKAANELYDRIDVPGIRCSTFHKLAYDILTQVNNTRPTISDPSLALIVFQKLLKDHNFITAISRYFVDYLSRVKDPEKYESYAEYIADRKKFGINSLFPDMDGNIIYTKSEQEKLICHFLSTHSVLFRYEENYEFEQKTTEHRQYKPDFSIYIKPEVRFAEMDSPNPNRIYLEHFGIDKFGNVPKWFGENESGGWQTANKKYRDGIFWKRRYHKEHGTILIETTSAMFTDGTWKEQLTRQLQEHGIVLKEKTPEEIYDEVVHRDKHKEKVVLQLITAFISLLKANCKSIDDIAQLANATSDRRGYYIISEIMKPFLEAYQAELCRKKEIDFTDAILNATAICEADHYRKYKYIVIDEFQDISFDRYKFLLSLRNIAPLGKIFAVGDDWQSIYRFSGSDMALFNRFEDYFGFTTQCKIETTYRYGQPCIDIASDFIQQNKSQVRKNVRPFSKDARTSLEFKNYNSDESLTQDIVQQINQIPINKSIFILSRYNFDFNVFKFIPGNPYKYSEDEDGKNIFITVNDRRIRCMTIHQAKGLEADYIFILKCNSDIYGFPSMITDDPVLEYVLSKGEDAIEFAEERRVFYVAMTRAKIKTTIYYNINKPSVFVDEIAPLLEEDEIKRCPKCHIGHQVIRKADFASNGNFYVSVGCDNYPACDFYHTRFFKQQLTLEEIESLVLATDDEKDFLRKLKAEKRKNRNINIAQRLSEYFNRSVGFNTSPNQRQNR